jgi:hypothetical protein
MDRMSLNENKNPNEQIEIDYDTDTDIDEGHFEKDIDDLNKVQHSPLFQNDITNPNIRKNNQGYPMYYRVLDGEGNEIIDERTGRHLLVPIHLYFHGMPDDPYFAKHGLTYADVYHPRFYKDNKSGRLVQVPLTEVSKHTDPIWKGDLWRECYYANDVSMGTNLIGDNINIFRDVNGAFGRNPGENILGMPRGSYIEEPKNTQGNAGNWYRGGKKPRRSRKGRKSRTTIRKLQRKKTRKFKH